MKMFFKKSLSLFLAVLMVFSVGSFALAEDAAPENGNDSAAFTAEDFLTTKGMKVYNQKGEEVKLKGVNLGSWLIWEDWLTPYDGVEKNKDGVTDHMQVVDKLTERFGVQKAYELMNTYMDNWITEYDLDQIKALGFNSVRVPFWYRNFYYDDNGTKILDKDGNWDFSRLDWVVEECSKRGIYVVLDMHGAVGYQSDAPHNGKLDSCHLYDKTEQGEKYRKLTAELWTAIAERFRGNPAVAMYDLLNEPGCEVEKPGITRRINNEKMYSILYDAVRAVDPEHIITLECIWTAAALPHAWVKGWKNVVYQVHFYQNSDFIFTAFCVLTRIYHFGTPLMMGEFYPLKKTTWKNCFKTLNKLDFGWFLWTYKAANHGMWNSDWCLFGMKDGFERANVSEDSYEEIARKWGECLRTRDNFQNTGHYEKNVKDFL